MYWLPSTLATQKIMLLFDFVWWNMLQKIVLNNQDVQGFIFSSNRMALDV